MYATRMPDVDQAGLLTGRRAASDQRTSPTGSTAVSWRPRATAANMPLGDHAASW